MCVCFLCLESKNVQVGDMRGHDDVRNSCDLVATWGDMMSLCFSCSMTRTFWRMFWYTILDEISFYAPFIFLFFWGKLITMKNNKIKQIKTYFCDFFENCPWKKNGVLGKKLGYYSLCASILGDNWCLMMLRIFQCNVWMLFHSWF